MKTNRVVKKAKPKAFTHEGTPSNTNRASYEHQLRRLVMAHMLWEDQFYISGKSTTDLIKELSEKVSIEYLGDLAFVTRTQFKLRHVPLLLLAAMVNRGRGSQDSESMEKAIVATINRPDEMGELIALYNKVFVKPAKKKVVVPSVMKRALAEAFLKFDEYQLSKYASRPAAITLRDVMFLVHPNPSGDMRPVFRSLAMNTLTNKDTWESQLSAGGNKKEVFEKMLEDGSLGGLAFLKNMRNIINSGVSKKAIRAYMDSASGKMRNVLPFRFFKAKEFAGEFVSNLEMMMIKAVASRQVLKGKTLVVVDVSGSMQGQISGYSELNRENAAAALASIAKLMGEAGCVDVVATGNRHVEINKNKHGFALAEAIRDSGAGYGGIYLKDCMEWCSKRFNTNYERVIVVTDEQDCGGGGANSPDKAKLLGRFNYIINVGAYQNGIGFGKWTTITGFSEAVFDFMAELESNPDEYKLAA